MMRHLLSFGIILLSLTTFTTSIGWPFNWIRSSNGGDVVLTQDVQSVESSAVAALKARAMQTQAERDRLDNGFRDLKKQLDLQLWKGRYRSGDGFEEAVEKLRILFESCHSYRKSRLLRLLEPHGYQEPELFDVLYTRLMEKGVLGRTNSAPKVDTVELIRNLKQLGKDGTRAIWHRGWGEILEELWTMLKAPSFVDAAGKGRRPSSPAGWFADSSYARKKMEELKDDDEKVFAGKRWYKLIRTQEDSAIAILPEPAPWSNMGAVTSVAWGLLNYLIDNQVHDQNAIKQIILEQNEYESALRDFIVKQCATSTTIDAFFDRHEDFQKFISGRPELQHISRLLQNMSANSWKVLELGYLERYLKFYAYFPFSSQKFKKNAMQRLRTLLEKVKRGKRFRTAIWSESAFGVGNKLVFKPLTGKQLDAHLIYHMYLYQTYKYCQKHLKDLVRFDEEVIRNIEIFGILFKAIQEIIGFWRIVTQPGLVTKYQLQNEKLSWIFLFQNKLIPAYFKEFNKSTHSYFEYKEPIKDLNFFMIHSRFIDIYAWPTELDEKSTDFWSDEIRAKFEKILEMMSKLRQKQDQVFGTRNFFLIQVWNTIFSFRGVIQHASDDLIFALLNVL